MSQHEVGQDRRVQGGHWGTQPFSVHLFQLVKQMGFIAEHTVSHTTETLKSLNHD